MEDMIYLYKKVLDICKDKSKIKNLDKYFSRKTSEIIKYNIGVNRGIKFGWLKVCCTTNFNEFERNSLAFIKDNEINSKNNTSR